MCNKRKKKGAKRIAMLAILLVAFALIASSVYADTMQRFSNNQNVETYVISNSSGTAKLETAISTATISPANHRILGYSISPYDTTKGSEFWIGLYDDATNAKTSTDIIDESEWGQSTDKSPRWYPYPRELTDGLVVLQGMNTTVVIYYEDKREI